ncbi:MAG: hypothetical protein QM487_07700 [Candidatus Marithrix sp.]
MSLVIFTEKSIKFKSENLLKDERFLMVKNIVNKETKQSVIYITDDEGLKLVYNSTFKINSKSVNDFFESMNEDDQDTVRSQFTNVLHGFSSGLMCYYALILLIEHGYKIPFEVKLEEPIVTINKFNLADYILETLMDTNDQVLLKLFIFVRNFINIWGSLFPEGDQDNQVEVAKIYNQVNRGLLLNFNSKINTYQSHIEAIKTDFKRDIDNMLSEASINLEKTYQSILDRSVSNLTNTAGSLYKNIDQKVADKFENLSNSLYTDMDQKTLSFQNKSQFYIDKIENLNKTMTVNKSDFSAITNASLLEENEIPHKSRFKQHFGINKSSKSVIRKFI